MQDGSRIGNGSCHVIIISMKDPEQYVRKADHGVLRIGRTRVSLDSLVYRFLDGDSPEGIQRQFPALSLEQVYGATTYYLANRKEVDQYLEHERQFADELQRELERNPSPVVERLRAIKAARANEQ